jgi:hypothetical protein
MNMEMQWRIVNKKKAQDGVARWIHALVLCGQMVVPSTLETNTFLSNASQEIGVSIYSS